MSGFGKVMCELGGGREGEGSGVMCREWEECVSKYLIDFSLLSPFVVLFFVLRFLSSQL